VEVRDFEQENAIPENAYRSQTMVVPALRIVDI
jgi:hypothetical protein